MGFKDLLNPYSDLVTKPIKTPIPVKEKKAEEKRLSEKKEEIEKKPKKEAVDLSTTTPGSLKFAPLVKLYTLILKDIKLLIRSKSSSLVVVFGPLLVIFLVGMAFNTSSMYDLKIATYSESYSELSNSIITHLQDEQYSTIKTDNLEDCVDGVRLGKFHVCAAFSPGMAVENEAQNTIKISVDESRMNLAHMIELVMQKKVTAEVTKISEGLTGNIVMTMFNTKDVLQEKKGVITKLSGTTSDGILKVSSVKDDLEKIDLAYNKTDINYTNVRNSFEAVKGKMNTSAACLTVLPMDDPLIEEVDRSINYLKSGVEALVGKFDSIVGTRESSLNNLDSLGGLLKEGSEDLNLLRTTLDSLIAGIEGVEVTDVEKIVAPVTTNVEPVAAKRTHLGYQFPTFVILIVMFSGLLLAVTVTIREKLSKAFFRNFIVPTSDFLFMFGSYFTNILIVAVQLGILFVVGAYFLPELRGVIFPMIIVLLLVSTVFVLMGMFIGFVFKSEETATLGAISVGSILLFFSNAILPIETLPAGIRDIAKFNPFVLSVSILKRIMLFGANFTSSFKSISIEVYMLLCFVLIFFVLAFVAREITKSRMR